MGQTSACSYWPATESGDADADKENSNANAHVNMTSSDKLIVPNPAAKGPGDCKDCKTIVQRPSDMLKQLKQQENKKAAEERWARTKAEWEANVIKEMEERDQTQQQQAPGTEPDRFAANDRMAALQAIKEEEELKNAEASNSQAHATKEDVPETVQALPEQEDASKVDTAVATDAEETVQEPVSRGTAAIAVEPVTEAEEADDWKPRNSMKTNAGDEEPAPVDTPENKAKLDTFLAKNGFDGVNSRRRRTLRPSICALHLAAEKGDTDMIELLIAAGADRHQKDSSGRTPEDIARKKNKKGSHDQALAMLAA